MIKFICSLLIFSVLQISVQSQNTYSAVLKNVAFYVYKQNLPTADMIWGSSLASRKADLYKLCPPSANVSWIVHGWLEGHAQPTAWFKPVIQSTLEEAGGCVILMDYYYYSQYADYFVLVTYYKNLRDVLVTALKTIEFYERMHVFGFSFGARLAQGAGNVLTAENKNVTVIPRMDLCDPASYGFLAGSSIRVNAKTAAKNVACINTSNDKGTTIYDCHQNFRMGHCGKWQDGETSRPMLSHGMCPHIYNAAFKHNFVYNSLYQNECYKPLNLVNTTCQQTMIMGFRNRVFCYGDILIPTAKCKPYLYTGTINNYPAGKSSC